MGETTLKCVFFQIADMGGICYHRPGDNSDEGRPYMNVYRLCGYNLNLNISGSCDHMVAFRTIDYDRLCYIEHHYSKFAYYTGLFEGPAYPVSGCFPTQDDRCHNINLGFVFEEPKDAAVFKISCEFPTHTIDFPTSFIYK